MSESGQQIQNQPPTDGYPARDKEIEMRRSRWLIALLMATGLLVIMAVGAYFLLGRELFQRPFLVVAVLVAWLGALVGLSLGSDPG